MPPRLRSLFKHTTKVAVGRDLRPPSHSTVYTLGGPLQHGPCSARYTATAHSRSSQPVARGSPNRPSRPIRAWGLRLSVVHPGNELAVQPLHSDYLLCYKGLHGQPADYLKGEPKWPAWQHRSQHPPP